MESKRNLGYKLSKWLNGTSWSEEKARSLTERLCESYSNAIGVNYNERCGMPQREVHALALRGARGTQDREQQEEMTGTHNMRRYEINLYI